jgi:hypothetical protein
MMNDANALVGEASVVTPPGKLAHATPDTAPPVAGRSSRGLGDGGLRPPRGLVPARVTSR